MKPFVYILAVSMISCSNPRPVERSKNVDFEAELSDTLYWQKAIVCNRLVDNLSRVRESKQENLVDSIFHLFETAISKSSENIYASEPIERITSLYFQNQFNKWDNRLKKLATDSILSLVPKTNKNILLPLIYITEEARLNVSSSLSGGISGGGIYKKTDVFVMLVIVRNKEIIYKSSGIILGEEYLVDNLDYSRFNIEIDKMEALINLIVWKQAKNLKKLWEQSLLLIISVKLDPAQPAFPKL